MSSARPLSPPADWTPSPAVLAAANATWLMNRVGAASPDELHAWSVQNRADYWAAAIERLGVRFQRPADRILDASRGVESPQWLPGARLNVVESCFTAAPESLAIVYQAENGRPQSVSYGELRILAGRVAAGLARHGFRPGDAIALLMPMTLECVAIYLGILQAGCVAVSIADSFRPNEIHSRLSLAKVAGLFTQHATLRGGKWHPLYAGAREADAPPTIVLPEGGPGELRETDCRWEDFLPAEPTLAALGREPGDPINILFSSGTTGEPKVIPWTQTTPIKCAADAHFHQDVHPGDVLVWPTNIGWMMGPWLIFAALMNRAQIGLFYGAPTGREFCHFVEEVRATLLGVVPSLVKAWRASEAADDCDWSSIRAFSSTGECSNPDDMRWLMARAGGKPVIEYCGGTEIGGAYITGTLTKPNVAGTFNTPALGSDFVILDAEGQPANAGEVFLVPPSMGLSVTLLNKDHHEAYYAGVPRGPEGEVWRRHGDEIESLPGGYWRAHGRADDTMNLGGIKVSSAEIERTLQSVPGIIETAAIAVSPSGGPSLLVIYAVCQTESAGDPASLKTALQEAIKRDLNPLFKIHDVVRVDTLPRTASHKILRRALRDRYTSRQS